MLRHDVRHLDAVLLTHSHADHIGGIDDLRHAAFVTPALTTVHLPLYEVGALACERLIERAHGRTERVAERLPTHLIVRESTTLNTSATAV